MGSEARDAFGLKCTMRNERLECRLQFVSPSPSPVQFVSTIFQSEVCILACLMPISITVLMESATGNQPPQSMAQLAAFVPSPIELRVEAKIRPSSCQTRSNFQIKKCKICVHCQLCKRIPKNVLYFHVSTSSRNAKTTPSKRLVISLSD